MDAHAVPLAQLEGLVDPVDRAEPGGAGGEHDGADVAGRAHGLEGVEVDPALRPGRHLGRRQAEDLAHARMRVVGIGAERDALVGMQLTRDPQRLQVRDRSARGQVPEERLADPEQRRQLGDRLLLHLAGHRPAVERVVVGVHEHGRDVAGGRRGVRRLEHLAGEPRVEEREVPVHPALELLPRRRPAVAVDGGRGRPLAPARLPRLDEVERGLDAGPVHARHDRRLRARMSCRARAVCRARARGRAARGGRMRVVGPRAAASGARRGDADPVAGAGGRGTGSGDGDRVGARAAGARRAAAAPASRGGGRHHGRPRGRAADRGRGCGRPRRATRARRLRGAARHARRRPARLRRHAAGGAARRVREAATGPGDPVDDVR